MKRLEIINGTLLHIRRPLIATPGFAILRAMKRFNSTTRSSFCTPTSLLTRQTSFRYFRQHAIKQQQPHLLPAGVTAFPCVTCGRTFGSPGALEQHQKNTPEHPKGFNCNFCKGILRSEEALAQHQRDAHGNSKTLKEPANASLFLSPDNKSIHSQATPQNVEPKHENHQMNESSGLLNIQEPSPVGQPSPVTASGPEKQAKKTSINPEGEKRTMFQFPKLHERIQEAVFPDIASTWFNENDHDKSIQNKYRTNVIGRFTCENNTCKKCGWSSGRVAIEIKGYARHGYHATVFNQRCKACKCLGALALDEQSYVDRIAYRLKKWAGVAVIQPNLISKVSQGPHKVELCEGCKRGICPEGD